MKSLIEKQIQTVINQNPELKQLTGRSGKALQINVQIIGNHAIDRACADMGDIKEAMRRILFYLPEPRHKWLKILALAIAFDDLGAMYKAADYLGYHTTSKAVWNNRKEIKAIQNGQINFKEKTEMPSRDEMVQPDGSDL